MANDDQYWVSAKGYAEGKIEGTTSGPKEWSKKAAQCLAAAIWITGTVRIDVFRAKMKEGGVPDSVIEVFCKNMREHDHTLLNNISSDYTEPIAIIAPPPLR